MARPKGIKQSLPGLIKFAQYTQPYIREKRGLIFLAFACLFAQAALRMVEPWPLKFIIDRLVISNPSSKEHFQPLAALNPIEYIAWFAVILVVITMLRAIVTYIATISMAVAGNHIIIRLREKLFTHLQGLSVLYHQKQRSGDLIVRLIGDMGMIKEVSVTAIVPLLSSGLIFVLILSVMLWLNWQLALIALIPLPILWLVTLSKSKRIHSVAKKNRQREGDMAATAAESIGAIKSVQALKIENRFGDSFRQANSKSLKEGVKGKKLVASLQRTVEILVALSTALVLTFGSLEVLAGRLTPGGLIVFVYYLRRVFRPIRDFTKYTARLAKASAAGERVLKVLDEEHAIKESKNATPAPNFIGHIQFSNLSFTYPGKQCPAIHNVNLTVPSQQRLAIIGASGSGKSTLISLLLRLHDPSFGKVKVDNQDIRQFTLESYREQFSVVMQETALFSASIGENIAIADPNATPERIIAAAKLAKIDDFVQSLPEGYDTHVSERGVTLSAGQRQRIAIARAALKNSPILILDEPTTGLDPETESSVSDALLELSKGKTTLWITHRHQCAELCDAQVEIKNGQVIVADSTLMTTDAQRLCEGG
ncbi:ABC transporter ATP-binding protein [Vibrio sinaloensis]|uniref:ABC transporter ATP-binding protein n=1 Tax=Photobacterium sp. (strain ATCC 43367) TaxID=379097 RepID=UPI0006919983|nr:ABC transporter ATP-binding protein [Vibrio sinaloensis]